MNQRDKYIESISNFLVGLETYRRLYPNLDSAIAFNSIICKMLNLAYGYSLVPVNEVNSAISGIDYVDVESSVAVRIISTSSFSEIYDTIQSFSDSRSGQAVGCSCESLVIFILSSSTRGYKHTEKLPFSLLILSIPVFMRLIQNLSEEKLEQIIQTLSSEGLPGELFVNGILHTEWYFFFSGATPSDEPITPGTLAPSAKPNTKFSVLSVNQQQMLRLACFLPQGGLPWELFRQCLSEAHQQALLLLVSEGFLTRQDDYLHISPEVRQSTLKQLHLTREISTEFLDRLLQFDRTYFWQHLKFFDRRKVLLQLAKAFGQASDLLQDFDGTIALRSAAFYSDVNETAKALQWCLRAVQCCESAPSRDPWDLANAYLRTAECYQQLNDNASSLKYCKKLLSLPNKYFFPADPDIARIYYQTGLAQVGLNDHTAALKSLSKAQGYSQNTMTVDHPLQSRISNMLSIANKATGNILEAREQKLQSLREFQSRPVINSTALVHKLEQLEKVQAMPAILRGNKDEILYCEIGDLYHAQGDYVKALEYHMLAVKVREQRPETAPKKLADSYHSIGVIFSDLNDYSEALEYLLKAKAIREESSCIPTHDRIRSCLDLGAVYCDLGMHQHALEELASALVLQKKHLPPQAPELAETYTALGNVCRTLGQDQNALNYFNDAVIVLDTSQLGNRTELAAACMNLANAQIQLTYYRKALHHAQRALDIYSATLPTGHPQRITTQQTVAWLENMVENN